MKICERKKLAELWNAAACMGYAAIAMRRLGFELATERGGRDAQLHGRDCY